MKNKNKKNLVNVPDTVQVEGVLEAQDQVPFQTVRQNHNTNNSTFNGY